VTNIKAIFLRLWDSPSGMAWAALCARALSFFAVLPLVLKMFPPELVTVWLAFGTILVLLGMLDLGFNQTFTRLVAYAVAGRNLSPHVKGANLSDEPDWAQLTKIMETVRPIFCILGVFVFLLTMSVGSWYLAPLISATDNQTDVWIAWTIAGISSAMGMWGLQFSLFLNGFNQVTTVKRLEAVGLAIGTILGSLSLIFDGKLSVLILLTQGSVAVAILALAHQHSLLVAGRIESRGWKIHPAIFRNAWPSAWRGQIGQILGVATPQIAMLAYARLVPAAEGAPFFLAFRLITALGLFSQPPFYTRIPRLSTLYARHEMPQLLALAAKGMSGSCWVFAVSSISGGLLLPMLLDFLGSKTPFVEPGVWVVLALALFAERVGAMHLQMCALTNRINWHVANGTATIIFCISMILLIPVSLNYAIPLSMAAAYGGFLMWYAIFSAKAYLGLSLGPFEWKATIVPGAAMSIYGLIAFFN